MAKKVTYKYGLDELDMEKYLRNLSGNVLDYIASKGWNESQLEEFRNAYLRYMTAMLDQLTNGSSRFYTDDLGTIYDTSGEFNNKDNDDIDPNGSEYYYDNKGNRITSDDYALLKDSSSKGLFKKKSNHKDNWKTFSANREVASYFNLVAKNLKSDLAIKKNEKGKFSADVFGQNWKDTFMPGLSDYDWLTFLDDDEFKDGVRSRTNRLLKLYDFTDNYLNNFEGDSYDYEGSGFKDSKDYKVRISAFKNALKNGDWNEILDSARNAGINSKWLNNLLTDKEHVTDDGVAENTTEKSKEDLRKAAIEAGMKTEEQIQLYIDLLTHVDNANAELLLKQRLDAIDDLEYNQWLAGYTPIESKRIGTFSIGKQSNKLGTWTKSKMNDYQRRYNVAKALNKLLDFMKNELSENILSTGDSDLYRLNALKLRNWVKGNGSKKIDGTNEYYLPWTINSNDHHVITFDDNTGTLHRRSTINMNNLEIKDGLRNLWKVSKHQIGGNINEMGNSVDIDSQIVKSQNKKKQAQEKAKFDKARKTNNFYGAQLTNRSNKQIKAGMKESNLSGSAEDIWNNLSTTDKVRIVTALADVGSAATAYAPGYGTLASAGLGIGSTLATFGADMADDSVSAGSMWKNLAVNAGADVMGLLPGFGTAAKASKIAKALKPAAKPLMFALTALNTDTALAGANAIGRIISDPSKASKDDIIAALRGLQVVAGKGGKLLASRAALKRDTKKVALNFTLKGSDGKKYTLTEDLVNEIKSLDTDAAKNDKLKSILGVDPGVEFSTRGRNGSWNPLKWTFFGSNPSFKSNDLTYLRNRSKGNKFSNLWWYRLLGFRPLPNVRKSKQQKLSYKPILPNSPVASNISPNPMPLMTPAPIILPARLNNRLVLGAFKKGGNITLLRKMAIGGQIPVFQGGGSPETKRRTLNDLTTVDENNFYKADYDPDRGLFAGDTSNGFLQAYISNLAGNDEYRYAPTSNMSKDDVLNIENQQYYKDFTEALKNNEKLRKRWMADSDKNLPTKSKARFLNSNGTYAAPWLAKNNDYRGRPARGSVNNPVDYMYWTRNDLTLGARHTVYGRFGKRYFVRNADGTKRYVDGSNLEGFDVSDKAESVFDKDKMTLWNDYEVKEKVDPSKTDIISDRNPENDTEGIKLKNVLNSALNLTDDPNLHALGRAIYADKTDRDLTDLAIANERGLVRDPSQIHRRLWGNLRTLVQGENLSGLLNHMARINKTTDAAANTANSLEAAVKGNEAKERTKAVDDETQRLSKELAFQLEKENLANRHETAMFNRLSLLLTLYNKGMHELAYKNKKHEIWDTLWKQHEYDKRNQQELLKNINYQKSKAELMMDFNDHPEKYGFTLEEINLMEQSSNYANLDPKTQHKIDKLRYKYQAKMSELEADAIHRSLNASYLRGLSTAISNDKKSSGFTFNTYKLGGKLKDGDKIKIAKIRERIKNADRFLKGVLELLKRNLKEIERLNKALYKYPKLK